MYRLAIEFKDMPVRVEYDDETSSYVSHCLPFDVYSQGSSEDEALKNIVEATTLFLESCFSRGTLDAILKECGFQTAEQRPTFSNDPPGLNEKTIAVQLPVEVPSAPVATL